MVDASVVAKLVLDEPDSKLAVKVWRFPLVAPALPDVECASILWQAVRTKRITAREASERLDTIVGMDTDRIPDAPLLFGAMGLALQLEHPIRDCLHVEAAIWTGMPLVTADRRLAGRVAERPVPGCDVRTPDSFR